MPGLGQAVVVLPDQVLTLSNHERQVHVVRGHRAAERDGPQNHPHRDRGVSTPASGGGLEIILTEIGGADPLVGRARKIILTEIGGCRPPRREGPEITSRRSGGADPPSGGPEIGGVPRGGASKSSSRDPGFRRTLGGPMPAADVDLTLMIPAGQNDHRFVPGRACHADAVVRGLEIILTRSGVRPPRRRGPEPHRPRQGTSRGASRRAELVLDRKGPSSRTKFCPESAFAVQLEIFERVREIHLQRDATHLPNHSESCCWRQLCF